MHSHQKGKYGAKELKDYCRGVLVKGPMLAQGEGLLRCLLQYHTVKVYTIVSNTTN